MLIGSTEWAASSEVNDLSKLDTSSISLDSFGLNSGFSFSNAISELKHNSLKKFNLVSLSDIWIQFIRLIENVKDIWIVYFGLHFFNLLNLEKFLQLLFAGCVSHLRMGPYTDSVVVDAVEVDLELANIVEVHGFYGSSLIFAAYS